MINKLGYGMSNDFKQITHKYSWLRWACVPIASILGALLSAGIWTLLEWILLKFNLMLDVPDWYFQYIFPIIGAFIFGFFYIQIACYVAPSKKVATAIFMAVALILLTLCALYLTWFEPSAHILSDKIIFTLKSLANCVACIFATLIVKEAQEEELHITNSNLPIIRVKEN